MATSPTRDTREFDVQEVQEYADTIFEYMLRTEKLFLADEGYMKNQVDVNEKM